jgi:hypothetical protein
LLAKLTSQYQLQHCTPLRLVVAQFLHGPHLKYDLLPDSNAVGARAHQANPESVMTVRNNFPGAGKQFLFSDYLETNDQSDGVASNILTSAQMAAAVPFEVPTVIQTSGLWSFDPNSGFKNASALLANLVTVAAKGGNLLLNVGPGPDGAWSAA